MASVQDLANAIAKMEGWGVSGSIASRNNNPGNLRYAPNQIGTEDTVNGKFATFATAEDGWAALQRQIDLQAGQGQTLRTFIYQYAPPNENDTSNYLNVLASSLGMSADSGLSELYGSNVVDSVSGSNGDVGNTGYSGETLGIVGLVIGAIVVGMMVD